MKGTGKIKYPGWTKLARGRNTEEQTIYGNVLENVVTEGGILISEENAAIYSDRVKAPVVSAGSTNFGGSQKHILANQAGTEEVDRWALTASQKRSGTRSSVPLKKTYCRLDCLYGTKGQ